MNLSGGRNEYGKRGAIGRTARATDEERAEVKTGKGFQWELSGDGVGEEGLVKP